MTQPTDKSAAAPTVLYNGACPVCGTEIRNYRRRCDARDIPMTWTDISRDPAALQALGVGLEAAKERLHVLGPDGRLYVGVPAFLAIWPTVPGYGWLARLVGLPVVRPLSEFLYDRVLAPALYAWNRRRGR